MHKRCFVIAMTLLSSAAFGTDLYYVNDADHSLNMVDTNTLNVTNIGGLGTSGDFGDMAWDGSSSTMYYIGGRGDENLYTLNLATGAATLVGNYGISDMFALGCDSSGHLYSQATNGNFYSMDKATGVATMIGNNGVYPGGLTWNSMTGQMILLNAGGGDVYSVDLGTGVATSLASPGSVNDNDIAYDASTNSYWAMDWSSNLYSYDSSFNMSVVGGGFGDVASVEVAPVPEPATLTALGLGAVALLRKRRKA